MKLAEHLITSEACGYERKAWHLPCAGRPELLCLFLDGEYYVKHMNAPAILADLQVRQMIPPVECLFVSHVDSLARQRDFVCNPAYAEFMVRDVLGWLQSRAGIGQSGGHLLAGVSLSGLQAAYGSLLYPETFKFTLCQSGSLWWNDEWLTRQLPALSSGMSKARHYWISVGDEETASGVIHPPTGLRQDIDQITACKRFADAMERKGHLTHFHLYKGDHAPQPWRAELAEALIGLLG